MRTRLMLTTMKLQLVAELIRRGLSGEINDLCRQLKVTAHEQGERKQQRKYLAAEPLTK